MLKYLFFMQKGSLIDWKYNQSRSFDLLRFPMAIFVVFAHMAPITVNPISSDFSFFSWQGIHNFIGLFISKGIALVTVPTFFLISGYLFFLNLNGWDWNGYKKKLKSRKHTLFIPYIVWNVLSFLLIVGKDLATAFTNGQPLGEATGFFDKYWSSFLWNCCSWGEAQYSWVPWLSYETGPIDLPLWFIRDLMVIALLSPVVYMFVKKTRIWGVIVLMFLYVSHLWPNLPGLSASTLYFVLGAYFAINGYNVVCFARKYRYVFFSMFLISFSFFFYFYQSNIDLTGISQNLFIFSGVFCAFVVSSLFIEKKDIIPNKLLVGSCFFVYAEHNCMPIGALSKVDLIMENIIPGESYMEDTVRLIFCPLIAVALLVGVYWVLKRYTPKIANVLSGNR